MKIIQITAAYKPAYIYGGPTMSVAKLCKAIVENKEKGLKNKKHLTIEVLTTTANGKTELDVITSKPMQVEGVNVTYFNRLTKDHTHFSPALLWNLRKALRKKRSEKKSVIVHIHAWWNLVSVLSCLVAKWYHIPVVLSPRGMLTNYTLGNRNTGLKSIIHTLLGKGLLNYCHIHATSEKEKEDVLGFISPKSITIIPNLVALEEIIPSINNQKLTLQQNNATTIVNPFKLIFLSRIEKKKGLELLFDALAGLTIDWVLTIAGSAEKEYLEGLMLKAESLKIQNKINWLGYITNEDKFKLLAKHDLMTLTSYNENFANVVIESLSVGTPVLLADQVGLSNYVLENNFGWITMLDAKSILENLNKAIVDSMRRQQIRESSPKIIREDFNDKTLVEKYINLYENLANGRL